MLVWLKILIDYHERTVSLLGSSAVCGSASPQPDRPWRPAVLQVLSSHVSKLLTMGRVMVQQAGGRPTAPHAAFKELLVDAATVRLSAQVRHGRCRSVGG